MDVVICTALKDIIFLNKNLYFINKNINPDNIYVITNKHNFHYITSKYPNVTLIDENNMISGLNIDSVKNAIDKDGFRFRQYGWYFQQFLKIGFAFSRYAKKDYLAWDADTVPFNKLIFKEDNKYLFLPKTEHNPEYFKTIDNLFYAGEKADFSFISEQMLFDVSIVKEMISKICISTEKQWFEVIIDAIDPDACNGFSEFETYGTYCLNYHKEIIKLRYLRTFRRCGKIYGIFPSYTEIEELKPDLDTGSFEVYDYPTPLGRRIMQKAFYHICLFIGNMRIRWPKLSI